MDSVWDINGARTINKTIFCDFDLATDAGFLKISMVSIRRWFRPLRLASNDSKLGEPIGFQLSIWIRFRTFNCAGTINKTVFCDFEELVTVNQVS